MKPEMKDKIKKVIPYVTGGFILSMSIGAVLLTRNSEEENLTKVDLPKVPPTDIWIYETKVKDIPDLVGILVFDGRELEDDVAVTVEYKT